MRITSVKRPWGEFRQFTHNEPSTVKIITVAPNEELSLQFHAKRAEFWRVLRGNPIVTIGENVIQAKEGATSGIVELLEISTGDFDENDIVRLEDRYGRIA